MEVILLIDVDKVGGKHEVVSVKNGFGRNYLIPHKMAIIANTTNRKRLADLVRQEDTKQAKMVGHYQKIAVIVVVRRMACGTMNFAGGT